MPATTMDLEMITLSEVSQTKTNIWYYLYVESNFKKKIQMNLPTNRSRLTDPENKLWFPKRRRGGEGYTRS